MENYPPVSKIHMTLDSVLEKMRDELESEGLEIFSYCATGKKFPSIP